MDAFLSRGLFLMFFMFIPSSVQTTQSITSENYPDNYPPSFSRDYWFDVQGADHVLITFTNFSLEYSFKCSSDSLEIFYLQDNTYKFLAEYCGTWDIFSVVISSSKGAFRMTSDSTVESLGFRAVYSGIREDYNRVVNNTAGIVSSPRYHGKYPNNANHVVTILNRKGSRIKVKFLVFDIHTTDLLEVQDGIAPSSPVLNKLSGTTLPDTIYGYGEGIRLHFRSDLHFTRTGYTIHYTVEEVKECQDTDNGTEYQGMKNTTASGIACMHWRDLGISSEFHQLPENFCRNPDGRASPWCYTTKGMAENCSIERCLDTTPSNRLTTDVKKVGKPGETGPKENDIATLTPQKTTTGTPTVNTAPAGKPDSSGDKTSNNGGTADSSKRNLLVPITIGGVSFFVAALVVLLIIAKRKRMRSRHSMRNSLDIHPIELQPIDELSPSTFGDVKYERSRYHPNNIHLPSEEITYTAIDNIDFKTERSDSCTSDSVLAMDTTLRRFRDGKRLTMHFDEDGYGIVDGEAKDGFSTNDQRFALNRTKDGDYDHLRSFKVNWRKADQETEALYDHCQVDVIRESKLSNVFDDTYDHTSTAMLSNDLKSDDRSASDSNIYQECLSEPVTSI